MKHFKQTIAVLCILGCLLCSFSGCGNKETADRQTKTYTAEDDFGKALKEKDAFTEVARNDYLALSVKGTTAEVMIQDLQSGNVWYSNPQDRGSDTSAQTKQLGSQLDIWVYDENRILNNKNSVSDALEYGQVTYAQMEDGIRVTYVLGKQPTVFLAPTALSVERFEKELLPAMDADSQKYVTSRYKLTDLAQIDSDSLRQEKLKQYPMLAQRPMYIINDNLADFVKEKLETCFVNAGYTLEDLQQDNLENGIGQEKLPLIVTIPLEYTLRDDSLVVTVNTDAMDVPENAHISSLNLLRYFGAAGKTAEGEMVLADGSGSLIRMNNGKTHLPTLKVPVYGEDLTKPFEQMPARELTTALPIYGLRQGNQAFLTVIESGDAIASIEAGVAGQINDYNFIYSSYELTQQVTLAASYEGENEMLLFQKTPFDKPLQLRYFFLAGADANYVGMARRYRAYLQDTGLLQKAQDLTPSMHVELLGATSYTDTVMGIKVEKEQTLTTFNQAQTIAQQLHDAGVDRLAVSYRYWANGGSDYTVMDKLKPQRGLGGKDGLVQLQESLAAAGDRLYVTADLQYLQDDRLFDSYMSMFDAPKTVLGERTGKKEFTYMTLEQEGYTDTLTPGDYPRMAQAIVSSMAEVGLDGIDPLALVQELYSDFDRSNPIHRQDAMELVKEAMATLSQKDVLVRFPNAYGLDGADAVAELPAVSNGYYLCDASIPFYQIVLHGLIPYSAEAVNHAADAQQSLLQAAETGSSLFFSFMYEPNSVLFETDLQVNASYYGAWLATAAEGWQQLSGLLEQVQDSAITDHQILSATLRKTVYENGVCVYVNYGYEDVAAEGVTVPARSFKVMEVEG